MFVLRNCPKCLEQPRIWPCLTVFALAVPTTFVAQSVLIITIIAIKGGSLNDVEAMVQTPVIFLVCLMVSQLVYACASVIPAWLSPQPIRQRLGFVHPKFGFGGIATIMIGSLFVWQIGALFRMLLFTENSPSLQSTATAFTNASPLFAILLICCASVLPGFCEEMFCRGYIQRRLLQRWPPLFAVGFTGLGFAAMHLDPQHIVALIPLGLWLGYVAWRADSVSPSVGSHIFVNATAFGTVTVRGVEFAEASNLRFTGAILGLSLPFFVAAILHLEVVSRSPRHKEASTCESYKK